MQNAETVLDVLRERGRKGLPCEELYRQMFNKELYLKAYGRIVTGQVRKWCVTFRGEAGLLAAG
jgi:hypothetical protein